MSRKSALTKVQRSFCSSSTTIHCTQPPPPPPSPPAFPPFCAIQFTLFWRFVGFIISFASFDLRSPSCSFTFVAALGIVSTAFLTTSKRWCSARSRGFTSPLTCERPLQPLLSTSLVFVVFHETLFFFFVLAPIQSFSSPSTIAMFMSRRYVVKLLVGAVDATYV